MSEKNNKDKEKQKLMSVGGGVIGHGRIPIRSNIYNKKGYSPIGSTNSKLFDIDRKSPLLGHANASNLISGYYDRILELKGYQLLDIAKLSTDFFADYIINFLTDDGGGTRQLVTVNNAEDGSVNQLVTDRINEVLTKQIKIFEFIKNHIQDYIFFGEYYAMLTTSQDETGHTVFNVEELLDPVSVIQKRKRVKDGTFESVYLAKGEDNTIYEIPEKEVIYLAMNNLRLVNDLEEEFKKQKKNKNEGFVNPYNPGFVKDQGWPGPYVMGNSSKNKYTLSKDSEKTNREKVLCKEFYMTSQPLFYSLLLKVKELVVKEILVSLISLRDLSSVQIFLLQMDKSIPLERANDMCARAQKLTNNTNEMAAFLTSQFDATSFIENTLTQSAKFLPDYGAALSGKNAMLPLDKLSDKMLDIMQTLDQCKANILGPLGLPVTLADSSSGSKWSILQQSERANSRVTAFLDGLKKSILALVLNIYKTLYNEDLDPGLVKLHITEKTSVEYNNQMNQSESISGVLGGLTGVVQNALQLLDTAMPLFDAQAWVGYVQNLIKDIDPNTEKVITDETIQQYLQLAEAKKAQIFEQYGIAPEEGM